MSITRIHRSFLLSAVTLSLVSLMGLSSCRDSVFTRTTLSECSDESINVTYRIPKATLKTRASLDEADENRIDNALLIVYDSKGTILLKKKFVSDLSVGKDYSLMPKPNELFKERSSNGAEKPISIDISPNPPSHVYEEDASSQDIYCEIFANVDLLSPNGLEPEEGDPFKHFSNILGGDIKKLREAVFNIPGQGIYPTSRLVMWGRSKINLYERHRKRDFSDVVVPLHRLSAKITVTVNDAVSAKPSSSSAASQSEAKLELKSWNVFGLASKFRLYDPSLSVEKTEDGVSTPLFEQGYTIREQFFEDPGNTFTFYMIPYQMKGGEVPEGMTEDEYYKRLEKHIQNTPGEDIKFLHAPEAGPYIRLKTAMTKNTKDAEGSVTSQTDAYSTYYFHLGHITDKEGHGKKFEILPNHHYKYTLTISGVNHIITEVEDLGEDWDYMNNLEPNPAYDGDILRSGREILRDAYYETALLTFPKSVIGEELTGYALDPRHGTSWLHFKVNSNPTTIDEWKGIQDPQLMTMEQLLAKLKDPSIYKPVAGGGEEQVTIAVYIDEFYYPDRLQDCLNVPDRVVVIGPKSKKEHKSADKLSSVTEGYYTIRQKAAYTPYPISSLSPSNLGIAIQVIENPKEYTKYREEYSAGWDETYQRWSGFYNFKYGLTLYYKSGAKWTDILRREGERYLMRKKDSSWGSKVEWQAETFAAQVACMRMNRDENGNGTIDPEEIKWYLPALDELCLFTLAEQDMPYSARLGIPAPINRFKHYMTSYRPGNYIYNKATYYAEIGLSGNEQVHDPVIAGKNSAGNLGSQSRDYDYITDDSEYSPTAWAGDIYYRCCRVVGGSDKDGVYAKLAQKGSNWSKPVNQVPKPYKYTAYDGVRAEPKGGGNFDVVKDKYYLVEVNLEDTKGNIFRPSDSYVREELPRHNQISVWAKPARKFLVYPITFTNQGRGYLYDKIKAKSPCSEKYVNGGLKNGLSPEFTKKYRVTGTFRLPNASELYIMSRALVKDNDEKSLTFYSEHGLGWADVANAEYYREANSMQEGYIYWSSTHFDGANQAFYRYGLEKGIHFPNIALVREDNVTGYVRCIAEVVER